MLYYDYALTFGMEVKYIWCTRFRLSTALYVGCRYSMVANVIYLLTMSNKINAKVSNNIYYDRILNQAKVIPPPPKSQ